MADTPHGPNRFWLSVLGMLLVLFACMDAGAQTMRDSLETVDIRGRRDNIQEDKRLNQFAPGQKVVTLDSQTLQLYQMQSLSAVLAQRSPVFIKSYGLNGLATLNIRGASAAQSQVFWNGIPINNAALGIADVSVLPVSMINRLHLVYGSSSALWGSGNVGGALLLESDRPRFERGLRYQLSAGAGSFGQYQAGGKLLLGGSRYFSSTAVFLQRAAHDFPYTDLYGAQRRTEHARLRGLAVQQQLAFRTGKADQLKLAGWYQQYHREIPAALFESASQKSRSDASLKLMAEWNHKTRRGAGHLRGGLLMDDLEYEDDAIALHTVNRANQFYLEAGYDQKLGTRHRLLVLVPIQVAWIPERATRVRQDRYALSFSYRYHNLSERLRAALNLRQEWIDRRPVFLPGLNIGFGASRLLTLRGNVQRTYRAPVLNELFYEPGGNKDLRPESGWSGELGYKLEGGVSQRTTLSHDLAAFSRVIDNWIIWMGGAIWTPHNLAKVHSRGLETENHIRHSFGAVSLHAGLRAALTAATTVSSYLPYDGSVGKQIPYTPKWRGGLHVGFTFKGLFGEYSHHYTGKRFINTDETDAISAFHTGSILLRYGLQLPDHVLSFTAQIDNIYNVSYQVVGGRPMPGRQVLAGISLGTRNL